MSDVEISTRRLAINKANTQMVIVVAVAAFVTIFCLVASKTVLSQTQYQARVTTEKQKAHSQLQKNLTSFSSLASSYEVFDFNPTNVIGGSKTGNGSNDGDNAKIIGDALPAVYDFPNLTSSVESMLTSRGYQVTSISGTDDELNQQANASSPMPQPVPMPFSFSVGNASYNSINELMDTLQASIRPIQVDTINITGATNSMTLSITAHTYYQPARSLNITDKVVK